MKKEKDYLISLYSNNTIGHGRDLNENHLNVTSKYYVFTVVKIWLISKDFIAFFISWSFSFYISFENYNTKYESKTNKFRPQGKIIRH